MSFPVISGFGILGVLFGFIIFYFLGVDARGLRDQRARHWFEDCMDSHHHLCKLHRRAGLFFCARFTAEKISKHENKRYLQPGDSTAWISVPLPRTACRARRRLGPFTWVRGRECSRVRKRHAGDMAAHHCLVAYLRRAASIAFGVPSCGDMRAGPVSSWFNITVFMNFVLHSA